MMNAITINNLTKKYKNINAVSDLSLHIHQGEVFTILGTNGAGKSTTIKMLTTLVKPTSGTATIMGYDIIKEKEKIRKFINISPQETAIANNLTVLENLEFFAGIYNINDSKQKINDLIMLFKLQNVLKQKVKTLSGGYKRKVSIAVSLINSPKILFLDEPTLGLDVISRRELWEIINILKKDTTIILTTHYMEEAEALSDKIAIMNQGRLLVVDTPDNLKQNYLKSTIEEVFTSVILEEK